MRGFVLLLIACGPPPPTSAVLIAEIENLGPSGNYALVADRWHVEDGGLERVALGKFALVSGYLEPGESATSAPIEAPVDAGIELSVWLTGPEFVGEANGDGGCRIARVIPEDGLLVHAVHRSSTQDSAVRGGRSCEFSFASP